MDLDVSVPFTKNQITIIEWAMEYRKLLLHIVTDHAPNEDPIPPKDRADIKEALTRAEIVLWDTRLFRHACDGADAFTGGIVPNGLIPVPQLWVFTGDEVHVYGDDEPLVHTAELLFTTSCHVAAIRFGHPWPPGPPTGCISTLVQSDGHVAIGKPASKEAAPIIACASFMQSTVASSEELVLPRPLRRRCQRQGIQPPSVRVVHLRRREGEGQCRGGESLPAREYDFQWLVSAHPRRPNPRMKEQRTIWVNGYVKGPADKPLKPPAPNVKIVRR